MKRLTSAAGHPSWWLCPTPDDADRVELTRADVAALAADTINPATLTHWAAAIDTQPDRTHQ